MDRLTNGHRRELGTAPASARNIVGRERERRLLEELVATGETRGAAAVLLGEPGMGRTSLLGYVHDRALERGAQVIGVRGAESEAVLPFAAIADCCCRCEACS